jgi:thiol-disulfide isomerase/thioredoxin
MRGAVMRTFYENFPLCDRNNWRINAFVRIGILCISLVVISCSLVPQTFGADIDWRVIKQVSLNDPPIDITTSPDGSYVFILTSGAILVYSRADDKIVNRIPIDKAFDRISFSTSTNEFVLVNTTLKTIDFIKIYPISQVNMDGLAFVGPPNAPVTVAIFDNYQCPACAAFQKIMEDVLKSYPEEIKVVIKHCPKSDDYFSVKAAAAARAAQAQGKFWEFHRALLDNQTSLNDDTIYSIATQLELDIGQFYQDLHSQNVKAIVDRDISDARQLKIKITPTVFINGKFLERNSYDDAMAMIEIELNKQALTVK